MAAPLPSFVQGNVNSNGSSTGVTLQTTAFTNPNVAGNTLLSISTTFDATANLATLPFDTLGNEWRVPNNFTANGLEGQISAFFAPNCKAGVNTVSNPYSGAGASFPDTWNVEIANADLHNPIDAIAFFFTTSTGTVFSVTVNCGQSGDILVATCNVGSHVTSTGTMTQRVPAAGQDANGAVLATLAGVSNGPQTVTWQQAAIDNAGIILIALNPQFSNTKLLRAQVMPSGI